MIVDVSKRPALAIVAEDEPLLRLKAADLLGQAGFDVMEAGTAASALVHRLRIGEIILSRPPGPLILIQSSLGFPDRVVAGPLRTRYRRRR